MKDKVDIFKMDEDVFLKLSLAQERVKAAKLQLQLSVLECNSLVDQAHKKYEENGKYSVTELNLQECLVKRVATLADIEIEDD